jgi:hypothetical protein
MALNKSASKGFSGAEVGRAKKLVLLAHAQAVIFISHPPTNKAKQTTSMKS